MERHHTPRNRRGLLTGVGLGLVLLLVYLLPSELLGPGQAAGGAGCGGEADVTSENTSALHGSIELPVPGESTEDPFEAIASPSGSKGCPTRSFPRLMAFRVFTNDYEKDADGNAVLQNLSPMEFSNPGSASIFEFIHDSPESDLTTVEASAWGSCVQSALHLMWGVVMAGTSSVGSVFPGHWAFGPGTTLTQTAYKATTNLYVKSTDDFEAGEYAMIHRQYLDSSSYPAFDGHNWTEVEYVKVLNKKTSSKKGPYLEVERNETLSGRLMYTETAGRRWDVSTAEGTDSQVIVARISVPEDYNATKWMVNLSVDTPVSVLPSSHSGYADYNGVPGWKAYARIVYNDYFVGTAGGNADGVEFDEARSRINQNWAHHDSTVDLDNDLVTDQGYNSDGINRYAIGAQLMMKELRTLFDKNAHPQALVQADSANIEVGFRGFQRISGIEIENFPDLGLTNTDTLPWYRRLRNFSSAFTHLRQYVDEVAAQGRTPVSYGMTKEATYNQQCYDYQSDGSFKSVYTEDNHYFRIGLASALLVGMPHAYSTEVSTAKSGTVDGEKLTCRNYADSPNGGTAAPFTGWDEYTGGVKNQAGWLGSPVDEAVRYTTDLKGSDLMTGATWSAETVTAADGTTTYVSPSHADALYSASLSGPSTAVTAHTLDVWKAPAGARYGDEFFPKTEGVRIKVELDTSLSSTTTSAVYTLRFEARAQDTSDYASLQLPRLLRAVVNWGKGSADQWVHIPSDGKSRDYSLTFHSSVKTPLERVYFESGEGPGRLAIGNATLHVGSGERWIRYFDNGAVLLNMAFDTDSNYLVADHPEGDKDDGMRRANSGRIANPASAWTMCLDGSKSKTGFCRIDGTVLESNGTRVNNGARGDDDSKGNRRVCFTVPQMDALVVQHCP